MSFSRHNLKVVSCMSSCTIWLFTAFILRPRAVADIYGIPVAHAVERANINRGWARRRTLVYRKWKQQNRANHDRGAITVFTIPTSSSAPDGIALGPDGAMWFTESAGNKIGRITMSGAITSEPTSFPCYSGRRSRPVRTRSQFNRE